MTLFDRPSRVVSLALVVAALVTLTAVAHAQLQPPPQPTENPLTQAKANLGQALFWDEQISSTRTVSCGTCHIPAVGGEDPRSGVSPLAVHPGPDGDFKTEDDNVFGSPGVPRNQADGLYDWSTHFGLTEQVTGRRTVSAINAGYAPELFWDGRAPGQFLDPVTSNEIIMTGGALESQAVGPPVSDVEMSHVARVWGDVLARIAASEPLALSPEIPVTLYGWIDGRGYAELFEEAFGSPGITAPRVAMAIASYERTQFTDQSPFDQFLATGQGLTPQELAGQAVFGGVGRCDDCHQGVLMTDHDFHYNGVRPKADDPGREDVTGDPADEGKMRTPSLRNVELRAPYMHNGRFDTLEEVIDFYNREGDVGPNELELNHPIEPDLTPQQKADLLAFLTRPLTDPRLAGERGPFRRPALYTESSRVPAIQGSGVPGTNGLPAMVALEPPLIGNPGFTVGVWNAVAGADALLVIDDVDPGLTKPVAGELAFESIVLGDNGEPSGAGFGSVSVEIPDDPGLQGMEWFGRWYVDDPGAAGGVAVSRLVRFGTFRSAMDVYLFADGFESGDVTKWSADVQ